MKTTSGPLSIFLADDDRIYMAALKNYLDDTFKSEIAVHMFSSGEDCLKNIRESPDLVILDYFLNSGDPEALHGLQVMKKIQDVSGNTTVLILSAQNNAEIAATAVKYGAKEYIVKSEGAYSQIKTVIKNIIYNKETEQEWLNNTWNSLIWPHL